MRQQICADSELKTSRSITLSIEDREMFVNVCHHVSSSLHGTPRRQKKREIGTRDISLHLYEKIYPYTKHIEKRSKSQYLAGLFLLYEENVRVFLYKHSINNEKTFVLY